MSDENSLVTRLEAAVDQRVAPDRIEAFVGYPAIVHTGRASGWDTLRLTDVGPDPAYSRPLPDLLSAETVAYWRREDRRDSVAVSGLLWRSDDRIELFHGLVYPP
jgi:hypothetical protein